MSLQNEALLASLQKSSFASSAAEPPSSMAAQFMLKPRIPSLDLAAKQAQQRKRDAEADAAVTIDAVPTRILRPLGLDTPFASVRPVVRGPSAVSLGELLSADSASSTDIQDSMGSAAAPVWEGDQQIARHASIPGDAMFTPEMFDSPTSELLAGGVPTARASSFSAPRAVVCVELSGGSLSSASLSKLASAKAASTAATAAAAAAAAVLSSASTSAAVAASRSQKAFGAVLAAAAAAAEAKSVATLAATKAQEAAAHEATAKATARAADTGKSRGVCWVRPGLLWVLEWNLLLINLYAWVDT